MPTTNSGKEQLSKIIRDWSEIDYVEAFLILAVGILIAWAIKWMIPKIAERLPDRFRFWVLPWEPLLRLLVLFSVFTYVVPMLIHPTSENIFAILGTLAVALGFAFKDYASSLIAGVVVLYERLYRNGDWIEIEGNYGEVVSLNLRTVQICTPDDTIVSIPHNKIWTTAIHNSNSGHRELMCVVSFYLHPDHDGNLVRDRLIDVAMTSPYLNLHRPVLVVATEEPWGTHYRLKSYPIDGRDQFQFMTDLTLRGKGMFRRLSIRQLVTVASVPTLS